MQTAPKTMENPQVQYIGRIVDVPVMTESHVAVTMQRQVPTIKRVQRTMSLMQVPCIDEDVDVFVAMRDKLTLTNFSRHVERQLLERRTLAD